MHRSGLFFCEDFLKHAIYVASLINFNYLDFTVVIYSGLI